MFPSFWAVESCRRPSLFAGNGPRKLEVEEEKDGEKESEEAEKKSRSNKKGKKKSFIKKSKGFFHLWFLLTVRSLITAATSRLKLKLFVFLQWG